MYIEYHNIINIMKELKNGLKYRVNYISKEVSEN